MAYTEGESDGKTLWISQASNFLSACSRRNSCAIRSLWITRKGARIRSQLELPSSASVEDSSHSPSMYDLSVSCIRRAAASSPPYSWYRAKIRRTLSRGGMVKYSAKKPVHRYRSNSARAGRRMLHNRSDTIICEVPKYLSSGDFSHWSEMNLNKGRPAWIILGWFPDIFSKVCQTKR